MNWIPYALATAVLLALADSLVKYAAGKLPNSLALLLFGACTLTIGLTWVLWQRYTGVSHHIQIKGMMAATGAGITFTLVTLGLYVTFGAGAPISLASPTVRLGGLVLASLVGVLLLDEPVSWRYALGMLLAFSGIYLILTR